VRKKVFLVLCLQSILVLNIFATNPKAGFEVKNRTKKYSKLKSLFLLHKSKKSCPFTKSLIKIVSQDLDFTDQFDIELKDTKQELSQIKTKKLFDNGVSLLIFFKKNKNDLQVNVKDTSSGTTVFNKTVSLKKKELVLSAHTLSSHILKALTGDGGICLSTLAYCKQISPRYKVICVSDYAVKQSRVVVKGKTINLAPRWHNEELLYSQLTRSNNRLMSYNTRTRKHKVVSSYPGLNMQPAFSSDGKKVIVCLSGGNGNSELYLYDQRVCGKLKRRVYKKLTSNGKHNVSPSMLPNGDIVFCSDYQTGQPQIYYLYMKTKKTRRLTNGHGYAAAPAYCAKTNMIVYTRPIRQVFQLFALSLDDIENTKERQLTFGSGSKHEPCWSEDGRYVAFSIDNQIGVINFHSRKMRVLTRGTDSKTFPRWTSRKFW
jgi:TolB protein